MPSPPIQAERPDRPTAHAGALAVVLLLLAALSLPAAASATGDLGGLELIPETRKKLWSLQQAWGAWEEAFGRADREAAEAQLETITEISSSLGLPRLPDLSNAAAALAVEAAQGGDFERAEWALEAARELDDARPETDFARSSVLRLQGDYLGGAVSAFRGHILALQMPLERTLWLNNLQLWGLYTLVISGGLFIVLMMILKGSTLFYDLARLFSPPLDRKKADVLAVLLLVWPIVLPSGFLWLALYWSILLFTYGSRSEKGVLIFLWLILGFSPTFLSYQQRDAQLSLLPPSRLIDNMASGRLYGATFSDLDVLRSLTPDSPAVTELAADLHRRLGQWEYARAIYTELANDPDQASRHTATAYTNIGVYHHRQAEYDQAASYFQRATQADPQLAIAFFDLSQAYAQMFEWDPSHDALAQARNLDPDGVDRWKRAGEFSATESAVPVDGSLRRLGEIRQRLADLWAAPPSDGGPVDLLRRHRAAFAGVASLILALILQQARRQVGLRSRQISRVASGLSEQRWARVAIPGLVSGSEENGVLAYLGILLPVGLVMVSLLRGMGYRAPFAYEPGSWLALGLTVISLLVLFLVRIGLVTLSD